jgi:hypothetical protein
MTPQDREQLRASLRQSMAKVDGVYPADQYPKTVPVGMLRAAGRRRVQDPTRMMTLVEADGVLHWQYGVGRAKRRGGGAKRALRAGGGPSGEIVDQIQVEKLDISEVGKYLASLDQDMTPNQGLRRWTGSSLQQVPDAEVLPVGANDRVLVMIHGTFSNNDTLITELQATQPGAEFLGRCKQHYKEVLTFDHPTIAVSPVLNALDISRRLAKIDADIDVVCHSRGGLVTRWWLEAFDRGPGLRRAVLVGSPLGGTSLAAPPRLRNVMSWLTNLNRAIATGASMIPFLHVVSGLARLTAAVTNVVAETPLLDAAVAMIPGLSAQSRIGNNFELNRLNVDAAHAPEYFAIQSNFETEKPGWEFWKYFVDVKKRVLDGVSDLVFPAENDLVVDTESMRIVGPSRLIPDDGVHLFNFGGGDDVYHTNYFRQAKTIDFISKSFEIP